MVNTQQTAFYTNEVMLKHSPKVPFESAERIAAQVRHIISEGLPDHCFKGKSQLGREATEEELELAHDRDYLRAISQTSEKSAFVSATKQSPHANRQRKATSSDTHHQEFDELRRPFAMNVHALEDCVFNKYTYTAAKTATGCVLDACEWVTENARKNRSGHVVGEGEGENGGNDRRNAFAAVRPPGHHACSRFFGGFCYVNQVAVAALYARNVLGLERVVVVDWDVHHGDGTEDILLKKGDNGILFFSIHRFGDGFFPGTGDVADKRVVENNGWRRTVNIPLVPELGKINGEDDVTGGFGNREYLEVFRQAVIPIMRKAFDGKKPQLILVSSGFDAAEGDMLGGFLLTAAGYSAMLQILCRSAENGHVVVVTEGGYTPHVNALCASACLRTLIQASKVGCEVGRELRKEEGEIPDVDPMELHLFPFVDPGAQGRTQTAIDHVRAFHLGEKPSTIASPNLSSLSRGMEKMQLEDARASSPLPTTVIPTPAAQNTTVPSTSSSLHRTPGRSTPPPIEQPPPATPESHTPASTPAGKSTHEAGGSNGYATPLQATQKRETRSATRAKERTANPSDTVAVTDSPLGAKVRHG